VCDQPEERATWFGQQAERTAALQRRIQDHIDRLDEQRRPEREGAEGAVQAGARTYPEPPVPAQHLDKPGLASALDPRPRYTAPGHTGSETVTDIVAIRTRG